MSEITLTESQLEALKWLREHNGDGVFAGRGGVMMAGGETGPYMRSTWNALVSYGLLERYGPKNRRVRMTLGGLAVATPSVESPDAR